MLNGILSIQRTRCSQFCNVHWRCKCLGARFAVELLAVGHILEEHGHHEQIDEPSSLIRRDQVTTAIIRCLHHHTQFYICILRHSARFCEAEAGMHRSAALAINSRPGFANLLQFLVLCFSPSDLHKPNNARMNGARSPGRTGPGWTESAIRSQARCLGTFNETSANSWVGML